MKLKRWRWRKIIIRKLKMLLSKLIPRIYNLPQIIYINWLGYEWYITKY